MHNVPTKSASRRPVREIAGNHAHCQRRGEEQGEAVRAPSIRGKRAHDNAEERCRSTIAVSALRTSGTVSSRLRVACRPCRRRQRCSERQTEHHEEVDAGNCKGKAEQRRQPCVGRAPHRHADAYPEERQRHQAETQQQRARARAGTVPSARSRPVRDSAMATTTRR